MCEYVLEAKGIIKKFPGVKALDDVNLKIRKGEIHALVGENGAGKSTLMLTLGGVHKPDSGEIFIDGELVSFNSINDANRKGISVVFQELSLVPNLSVAENIFANRQPVNKLGMVDWNKLRDDSYKMLELFKITNIDPFTLVKDLSIANQQIIEILKAMSYNPKVLILDEPTSSLTDVEVRELFKNIKILKEKGISFIYISHHLQEIFEIADTVTILRDGQFVCSKDVKDVDEDFLVSKMVGRKIENVYGERALDNGIGEEYFKVINLNKKKCFSNISFSVNKGEIVGFAGLVGSGRTEVMRAIFGADSLDCGEMFLEGRKLKIKNVRDAINSGIGYMTEDRKSQGLYLDFSIEDNMISNHLSDFDNKIFMNNSKISKYVEENIKKYRVITPSKNQKVKNLSGGNQQKVLLTEWIGISPKLLIVDEPTRGVDVGARGEIYNILREICKKGIGIIIISSDLPEVIGLSDRIIIMKEGAIAGQVSKKDATEEKVIAMATGVKSER